MHAKQMQALDAIPEIAARVRGGLRPRLGRARARLPHRRRRDDRRRARLGARHDRGRRRRAARARACAIGALGDHVLPAVPARRGARGARRAPSGSSCSRRRSRSASAGSSARTCGSRSTGSTLHGLRRGRRPRRPADHEARRCTRCSRDALADRLEPLTLPRPRPRARRARARAHGAARRSGPHAENILRDLGAVAARAELMPYQQIKFYQVGTLRGRQPAARPRAALGAGRRAERSNTLTSGHRACQGCGEALGARYALDAAMRATERPADRRQRDRLPRGLLDAVPRVVVAAAVAPLAVRQRAGGRDRHRRGAARPRAATTSAWSARAATAARSTSASPACRGCSSATTTCSTSATTTRPT